MSKKEIIVGSRGSELAITQTNLVIDQLKDKHPELDFKIKKIRTVGDKILNKTLNKIGGKGLFVKEIENALIKEEIDMAVHSMKDVPTEFPSELEISAILKREDMRDILVSKNGKKLAELRKGAKVGTSSLRRASQIKGLRPDIEIEPIRGNVRTRIEKIEKLNLDGVVLAAAGVIRLGIMRDDIQVFSISDLVPAVGQGALGIETRKEDNFMKKLVNTINHKETEYTVKAERSFMKILNGGCHVPIGAYAWIEETRLKMVGMVASLDGKKIIRVQKESSIRDFEGIGRDIGQEILNKGGREILTEIEGDD